MYSKKSNTFCKDKEYRLSLTRVPIMPCTRTGPLELSRPPSESAYTSPKPKRKEWKIRSSTFPGTSRLAQKGFNEHGPKLDQR